MLVIIPLLSFQKAVHAVAEDAVKHAQDTRVVGLGSGSTMSYIVKEMSRLSRIGSIQFVPTSLQIRIEAERNSLRIVDESRIPQVDVVFDGADQINSGFAMIKGGGGALLKEKILISAAKKVVIVADETKFVESFSRSVPVEVHPMARLIVAKKIEGIGGQPLLRILDKGYPFITENGNIILDTAFSSISDPKKKEAQLKSIAGVLEVGLFTRRADVYYKAKGDGTFEVIAL